MQSSDGGQVKEESLGHMISDFYQAAHVQQV